MIDPLLASLHLGPLHPVEQGITLLLAFGPFVVLGIVIAWRRRSDRAADAAAESGRGQPEQSEQPEQHEARPSAGESGP